MLATLAVLLAFASDAPLPAQDAWPSDAAGRHVPVCKGKLAVSARTILGIPVEQETIGRFEALLGSSPEHVEGDASTSLHWRCWEAANGDGTVLMVGTGEVHAEAQVLGREMEFAARGSCARSTRITRALATASGLRLGATRARAERTLGRELAFTADERWLDVACLGRERMIAAEARRQGAPAGAAFDVFSRVTVAHARGRVVGIRVMFGKTY